MAFPESFLQDLKMRNDITDVVSGYVNLKRRGRNMVGLVAKCVERLSGKAAIVYHEPVP